MNDPLERFLKVYKNLPLLLKICLSQHQILNPRSQSKIAIYFKQLSFHIHIHHLSTAQTIHRDAILLHPHPPRPRHLHLRRPNAILHRNAVPTSNKPQLQLPPSTCMLRLLQRHQWRAVPFLQYDTLHSHHDRMLSNAS